MNKSIKKICLSVFLSAALYPSCLLANNMEDVMRTSFTEAGTVTTENTIGWSGGSARIRWGSGDGQIQMPLSIQAPKINVGCGGIDGMFGGITFLKDSLVQAFQNISAVAPAFAFQLALKTLCSQCSATLSELQNIANQINAMAQDQCALTNALSGYAAQRLGFKQGQGLLDNAMDESKKWLSENLGGKNPALKEFSNSIKTFIDTEGGYLNNADKKSAFDTIMKQGSLIKVLFKDSNSPLAKMSTTFGITEEVMRGMVGDIVGYSGTTGAGDKELKLKFIPQNWSSDTLETLIQGSDGYTPVASLPGIRLDLSESAETGLKTITNEQKVTVALVGLAPRIKEQIRPILQKLGMPGSRIAASELAVLSSLPVPIYTILNNTVIANGVGNEVADLDVLANYIATVEAIWFVKKAIGAFREGVLVYAKDMEIVVDGVEKATVTMPHQAIFVNIAKNASNLEQIANQKYTEAGAEYLKNMEKKLAVRKLQQELRSAIAKTSLNAKTMTGGY